LDRSVSILTIGSGRGVTRRGYWTGGVGWVAPFREHREAIKRFGRYPTRNAALGRQNTPEEARFLGLAALRTDLPFRNRL
jgi:Bacterial protein of unknown function (DUF924)